ncbi:GNAT family N-acetyltransferase [Streptomyces synnematoformans]|uniref:N-acetyltransferase domain-containing protein n=1 Tax=Streptomyces synnematoformans TaxID=415721 RepID=A0ABN2ZDJ8_9ACTN
MCAAAPGGAPAAAPGAVRGLQERAARALPARQVAYEGGWWLRYDPGSSWWVASVLPHGPGGPADRVDRAELARRVARAEEFYAGHGAAARFQITPPACPAGLDDLLAGRGYHRANPVSLQVAAAAGGRRAAGTGRRPPGRRVVRRLARRPRPGRRPRRRPGPARPGHGPVRVRPGAGRRRDGGGGPRGRRHRLGRRVRHGHTLPAARGRGAGGRLLGALAGWAGAHGATHLYLQVERDNPAALRLYRRAGFREVCTYHYRTGAAQP